MKLENGQKHSTITEYLILFLIQRIIYKYSRKITFKAPHGKMTTFFNE